ncbi:MAG: DUF5658 family protein [Pseudomonadota bacterium]|jgi:hypothetical protein|nr:MAG: hypothetical protein DIU62_06665 [Pseudomonadota bacterium]
MHREFTERRSGVDRRSRSLAAYWHGALKPRRRAGRRAADATYPIIDWHSPRVLVPALAILLLCVTDGVLTIVLLANGAVEANPFMARFVPNSLGWFAAVKLVLTGIGVAALVACSRMRLFRAIPGELFLWLILAGYVVLVGYELGMLETLQAQMPV